MLMRTSLRGLSTAFVFSSLLASLWLSGCDSVLICSSDADCALGESCIGGFCEVDESFCPSGRTLCTEETAAAVCGGLECRSGCCALGCDDVSDCAPSELCLSGVCEPAESAPCSTGADCAVVPGAGLCDPSKALCVECLATRDCDVAEVCSDARRCVPAPDRCVSSDDCLDDVGAPLCSPVSRRCVACLEDTDCDAGETCATDGRCRIRPSRCGRDADCELFDAGQPLCDVTTGSCVGCLVDDDCSGGAEPMRCGVDALCVPLARSCESDAQCEGGGSSAVHCATDSQLCVECLSAADCGADGRCLGDGSCARRSDECTASADCAQAGGPAVCDTTARRCVACVADGDCSEGHSCLRGSCVPAVDGCVQDGDCTSAFLPDCDEARNLCTRADDCSVDTDCAAGARCEGGSCVTCRTNADCGAGEACRDGACVVGNCSDDAQCSSAAPRCRTWDHTCAECLTDADCPTDDCNTGRCDRKAGRCVVYDRPDGTACDMGVPEGVCEAGDCKDGCWIDGVFRPDGSLSPGNDCLMCDAARSLVGWSTVASGRSCRDDGNVCTAEACDGAGLCTHDARPDGFDCGAPAGGDQCWSGQCETYCLIDDQRIAATTTHPTMECLACDPSRDARGWSPKAASVSCADDSEVCTADFCDGAGECAHTAVANGSDCGDAGGGDQCWSGTCATYCLIGDARIEDGTTHPQAECLVCDPARDADGWSPKAATVSCANDGEECTTDLCDGNGRCGHTDHPNGTECGAEGGDQCWSGKCEVYCFIGGSRIADGATNSENECLVCDPSRDADGWSAKAATAACASDQNQCTADFCDGAGVCAHRDEPNGFDCGAQGGGDQCWSGQCEVYCFIGGARIADGATNSANECLVCDPSRDADGWSPKASTVACTSDQNECTADFCDGAGQCAHGNESNGFDCGDAGGGDQCWSGTCATYCLIGGARVESGTTNPQAECLVCDPARDADGWSPKASTVACSSDQNQCTADLCDGAGLCAHDNEPNGFDCGAVGGSDQCWSGQCDAYCLIGGARVESGATNAANECLVCDPSRDAAGWSPKASTVACASDGNQCTADFCDGAGSCGHGSEPNGFDCGAQGGGDQCWSGQCETYCLIDDQRIAATTTHPTMECLACDPSRDARGWSPKAASVSCADDSEVCTADFCDGAGECAHTAVANGSDCGDAGGGDQCWSGQCAEYCLIGGARIESGTTNPQAECLVCDPARDADGWSPKASTVACSSDQNQCTADLCDGAGQCAHTNEPNGFDCGAVGGSDQCWSGQCDAYCLIGGARVESGATNAANECLVCDPSRDAAGWSPKASTVACASDGNQCTADFCDGAGSCGHGSEPNGFDCGAQGGGDQCWSGQCETYCLIDDQRIAATTTHPTMECLACDPSRDARGWSPKAASVSCADDSEVCTADFCDGAGECAHTAVANGSDCGDAGGGDQCWSGTCATYCLIDGARVEEGTTHPQAECLVCDPARDADGWSPKASTVACSSDQNECTADLCDGAGACAHGHESNGFDCGAVGGGDQCWSGQCAEYCLIGGARFEVDDTNAANECLVCDPSRDAAGWSPKASSVACSSDGNQCTADFCDGAGLCAHGNEPNGFDCGAVGGGDQCWSGQCDDYCLIGGARFDTGETNAANECLVCDPSRDADGWSPKAATVSCSTDANQCTADFCDGAGVCAHGDEPNGKDCGAVGGDDQCWDGVCATFCLIGGQRYNQGDVNPAAECQVCDSNTNPNGWSPKLVTASCATDNNDCTDDHCSGAGACIHTAEADGLVCDSPAVVAGVCESAVCVNKCFIDGQLHADNAPSSANPCLVCDTGSALLAWSDGPAGVACDDGNACTADACDPFGSCQGAGTPRNGEACDISVVQSGVCNESVCENGCWIDASFVAVGEDNPAATCQWCTEGDRRAWSPKAEGQTCAADDNDCTHDTCDAAGQCQAAAKDDGELCDGGRCHEAICKPGCVIGGVYYDPFTSDGAGDKCHFCDPAVSVNSWTSYSCETTIHECEETIRACLGTADATTRQGQCSEQVTTAAEGTPCSDDGLDCNRDVCRSGVCAHESTCAPVDDCHDMGVCTVDGCLTGPELPDGASCDDGAACGDAMCVSGSCVACDPAMFPGCDQCQPVITALRAMNSGSPYGDTIEIYNPGLSAVDIKGYEIRRSSSLSLGARIDRQNFILDSAKVSAERTHTWLPPGTHYMLNAYAGSTIVVADDDFSPSGDKLTYGHGYGLMRSKDTPWESLLGLADAVSFTATSLYREGEPISYLNPDPSVGKTFQRIETTSFMDLADSGDNNDDFAQLPEKHQGRINSRMMATTPGLEISTQGSFIQPDVGDSVAVWVNSSAGIMAGDKVTMPSTLSSYTVTRLGVNALPDAGTPITHLTNTAGFTQPAVGATVNVAVKTTAALSAGMPVYLPAARSSYVITSISSGTSVFLMLAGIDTDGAPSGSNVPVHTPVANATVTLATTAVSFTQPAVNGVVTVTCSDTAGTVSAGVTFSGMVGVASSGAVYQVTSLNTATQAVGLKLIKAGSAGPVPAGTALRDVTSYLGLSLAQLTWTGDGSFTQPGTGRTREITVDSTAGMYANQILFIGGGAKSIYLVDSVLSATQVRLWLLGYGAALGATVAGNAPVYVGSPALPMGALIMQRNATATPGLGDRTAVSGSLRLSASLAFSRVMHLNPERPTRGMTIRNYHTSNALIIGHGFTITGPDAARFTVSAPLNDTTLTRCYTTSAGLENTIDKLASWPPATCPSGSSSTTPFAVTFTPPAGGDGSQVAVATLRIPLLEGTVPGAGTAGNMVASSDASTAAGSKIYETGLTIKLYGRY